MFAKFGLRACYLDLSQPANWDQIRQQRPALVWLESLVCHPASMTHASVPAEVRRQVGISEGLVRFSVGIEDVADLRGDIDEALDEVLR